MNNFKKIISIIIVVTIAILAYDVYLLKTGQPTISRTILFYSFIEHWCIIPYFVGVLVGHFFIPHEWSLFKDRWYITAIGIVSPLVIVQLLTSFVFVIPVFFVCGAGIISGTLFWNQKLSKVKR